MSAAYLPALRELLGRNKAISQLWVLGCDRPLTLLGPFSVLICKMLVCDPPISKLKSISPGEGRNTQFVQGQLSRVLVQRDRPRPARAENLQI